MSRAEDALSMDEPIEDPRPAVNPIEMETVRARAEAALFGRAAPPKVGRYHIIDRIAGGGMGVVYGAHDPDLDRRVALKVVHPKRTHDDRAQARLITEARALAKLDHPNVVKVHDVLTHEGSVVIVMEFVVGETLAAWAEQPHTWRDAVRVYHQAAQGLLAAHGVGVVHRDFKPSNAIIGADGRVRVLDFGLARLGEREVRDGGSTGPEAADLTETGDVLGTLAYAAPEQLRGEATTAASDQFSWCVSLHRTIEGVAPFAGTTAAEIVAAIETRKLAIGDAARGVPAWLRALIARGLSLHPEDRFRDMGALVVELSRPRGWRRFRIPLLVASTLGAGVATTLLVRGAQGDECDGGRAQLTAIWNASRRTALLRTLDAIGTPYAREVRDRVVGGLERYATDWRASHLGACRDHRKGATSAALLDRRMICLDERLSDLRAAASVAEQADAASLTNVVDVIARMPPIARCSDLERLRSDVEPPEGEGLREQVHVVRNKIAHVGALARAGRSEPARKAAVDAVESAMRTPYAPLRVEAALAESRTLMAFGEFVEAAKPLALARSDALELAMMPEAVEAAARLLYVENMVTASRANIDRDAAIFEPLSKVRGCAALARPLLLNNLGVACLSAGDRRRALAYFQEARAVRDESPSPDLELTVIDRNLAMLTEDDATRRQLAARVIETFRNALGATHPTTLEATTAAAEYEVDPATAYELVRTSTDAYRTFHPTIVVVPALSYASRAFLASELGDRTRAIADYHTAISHLGDSSDADIALLRSLCVGELALLENDPVTAERAFEQVRKARSTSTAWWEKVDLLRAEVGLGAAALARGRSTEAAVHLEAAIHGLPSLVEMNELMLYRRLLARAQHLLAGIVRDRGDIERAIELEQAARSFYERGPIGYAWVLAKK